MIFSLLSSLFFLFLQEMMDPTHIGHDCGPKEHHARANLTSDGYFSVGKGMDHRPDRGFNSTARVLAAFPQLLTVSPPVGHPPLLAGKPEYTLRFALKFLCWTLFLDRKKVTSLNDKYTNGSRLICFDRIGK